jgi:hypothetical protein
MVYLSQIEEARQGNFLVHNLYTSEPQIGYLSPLWVTLGWFSRLTAIPPLFTFHLFRIIFGFIFLYLLYLFISQIFSDTKWRKLTFLILCFASGLGVFTVIRPWTSDNMYVYFGTDIWFSEGVTFLTLYHSPLFILSQICLLLIFWWLIIRLEIASFLETIIMGLIGLFLGIFHTYDIIIVFSISSVWFILKAFIERRFIWSSFFKLAIFYSITALAGFYFIILKSLSPGFSGWAVQNVTLSPRPLNYMIGYGLIFILFLFGIRPALKGKNKYLFFLGVWAIVQWFLLFIPSQFQRKLGNGLHLPLVLIGMFGLTIIWEKLKQSDLINWLKNKHIIKAMSISVIIILLFSSNLFMFGAEFFYHLKWAFYLSPGEKPAMNWFKDNLTSQDVILSENTAGSIIPALTGRYVYLGHGHQTNNWDIKLYEVEKWFYQNNQYDQTKLQWLKKNRIDYVYYSSRERGLGNFQPQEKSYLKNVFKDDDTEIYQVI